MSDFKDVETLLRLKRYEQPPQGYFEDFAESFKERQRSEMLQQSSRGLFVERVSTYLWGYGPGHWILAGGVFTALAATGYWLLPEAESTVENSSPPVESVEPDSASLSEPFDESDTASTQVH